VIRLLICEIDHGVDLFPHARVRAFDNTKRYSAYPVLFQLFDEQAPFTQETNICQDIILLFLDALWYYHSGTTIDPGLNDRSLFGRFLGQLGEVKIVIPVFGYTLTSHTPSAKLVCDDCATFARRIWNNWHALAASMQATGCPPTNRSATSAVSVFLSMYCPGPWRGTVACVFVGDLLFGPIKDTTTGVPVSVFRREMQWRRWLRA